MINNSILEKEKALRDIISKYDKACIGFSGGVDSTLLLFLASQEIPTLAITADGAMVPRDEFNEAVEFGKTLNNIDHITFPVNPLDIEKFRNNTPDRCYACKKVIFSKIKELAHENNCDVIFDGANIDDLGDYRPGMKAVEELGVLSPFLLAGLNKSDIYFLSKKYELPTMNKASAACLASRIPTGEPITLEKLKKVEDGERILKKYGFNQLRLRLFDNIKGQLECRIEDFDIFDKNKEEIIKRLEELGINIESTPKVYKQGSMNDQN